MALTPNEMESIYIELLNRKLTGLLWLNVEKGLGGEEFKSEAEETTYKTVDCIELEWKPWRWQK